MTIGVPFCERPGQSAVVGALSGVAGGGVGLAAGLGPVGVAVLAGGLALAGELLGHALAGTRRHAGREEGHTNGDDEPADTAD